MEKIADDKYKLYREETQRTLGIKKEKQATVLRRAIRVGDVVCQKSGSYTGLVIEVEPLLARRQEAWRSVLLHKSMETLYP